MGDTKRFNRWWFNYCVSALDLSYQVLKVIFPRSWGTYKRAEWEMWSAFFREKMLEGFSEWTWDDEGAGMLLFRRGSVYIQELNLGMEADENVTFVQGPVNEVDMPNMWSLFWKDERMWVQYPSGKKLMIPLWGSHLRIECLARHIAATGTMMTLVHKED